MYGAASYLPPLAPPSDPAQAAFDNAAAFWAAVATDTVAGWAKYGEMSGFSAQAHGAASRSPLPTPHHNEPALALAISDDER